MIGMYFMMKDLADHGFRMVSSVFTDGTVVANRPHDFSIDTGLFFRHCFYSFLNGLVQGSGFRVQCLPAFGGTVGDQGSAVIIN